MVLRTDVIEYCLIFIPVNQGLDPNDDIKKPLTYLKSVVYGVGVVAPKYRSEPREIVIKKTTNFFTVSGLSCRGGRIRTYGLLVPNEARYRATLHPAFFNRDVCLKRSANIGVIFIYQYSLSFFLT